MNINGEVKFKPRSSDNVPSLGESLFINNNQFLSFSDVVKKSTYFKLQSSCWQSIEDIEKALTSDTTEHNLWKSAFETLAFLIVFDYEKLRTGKQRDKELQKLVKKRITLMHRMYVLSPSESRFNEGIKRRVRNSSYGHTETILRLKWAGLMYRYIMNPEFTCFIQSQKHEVNNKFFSFLNTETWHVDVIKCFFEMIGSHTAASFWKPGFSLDCIPRLSFILATALFAENAYSDEISNLIKQWKNNALKDIKEASKTRKLKNYSLYHSKAISSLHETAKFLKQNESDLLKNEYSNRWFFV